MRVINCRFLTSARVGSEYPRTGLPEIAFLGRSNVGKSSLINALTGRKALARTSRTPGRTQRAHFYSINDKTIFVDLPGYGFARVPGRVKAELAEVIESYLNARRPLALAVLLVDSRHEPTDLDLWMNGFLEERRLPVHVVGTKVDKLARGQRQMSIERIRRRLGQGQVLPFSSATGEGKRELWQIIDHRIGTRTETPPASPARSPLT